MFHDSCIRCIWSLGDLAQDKTGNRKVVDETEALNPASVLIQPLVLCALGSVRDT